MADVELSDSLADDSIEVVGTVGAGQPPYTFRVKQALQTAVTTNTATAADHETRIDALEASIPTLGTGVATFLATPSSANLATAVTGETGSGALVFATSPTLTTPNLGTPSAATLTSATGLPISTGVSGLGTGVATFLATPSSANLAAALTDETGSGASVFATSPTLVTPVLGTPASGVLTNCTGLPVSTGVAGLGTGVATLLATPSSANLAAALTDETGSGSAVFATSPTLVTPALGTPSALVLTNATGTPTSIGLANGTGLPISTGVSGLGTNVAAFLTTPSSSNLIAALTDETGTGSAVFATSPTLVTPVLGTPSSATLTNATGLPISSGVSGLGAGVATFLATPTSANLAAALTDETGSGAAVFATSPALTTPNIGTPSAGTLTSCTGLPIASGVSGLGSGVATFLATPSSANLAAAMTDETGTGANVFATSPTLVTPVLGTPSSGTLTSCTGLPISTGVSGLGSGVATALAAGKTGSGNVVLDTSPTLVTPVLGTPSSGTLTSCTGLPISSGVSGLAANVATFLATPSSANLIAAMTDETGTGANVFATSPTLVTPILGTPTSGTLTNCTGLPISTGVSGLGSGVATALAGSDLGKFNTCVAQSADVTEASLTTAIDIPGLSVSIPRAGTYCLSGMLPWTAADATVRTMGVGLAYSGTTTFVAGVFRINTTFALQTAIGSLGTIAGQTGTSGRFDFQAVIKVSDTGTLKMQFSRSAASITHTTGIMTVREGA